MTSSGGATPLNLTFASYYSPEQMAARQAHLRSSPRGPEREGKLQAWRDAFTPLKEVHEAAIAAFLTDLRTQGALTPVPFADRRGHIWATAWNRFVAGETQAWDMHILCDSIACLINLDEYAEYVANMDKGVCPWFAFRTNSSNACAATGVRLTIDVEEGWRPKLGLAPTLDDREFKPLTEEAPHVMVLGHQIPAPSGELLLADWIRLEDNLFTKLTVISTDQDASVNTAFGCAKRTAYFAKNFGFLHVQVGKSSPSIVMREDHFVLGYADEDEGLVKGEVVGSVCTDLWAVTMIDRAVLVSILAKQIGNDAAVLRVARLIDEHDVTVVHQPPGTVHFYHTAARDDIAKFSCTGPIDLNLDAIEPYVVVSRQPLVWVPIPACTTADAPGAAPSP